MTKTTPALCASQVHLRSRRARAFRYVLATLFATVLTFTLAPTADASTCPPAHLPTWHLLPSAGAATFRSLAAVNRTTAWIGSDDGTVLRTTNGGQTWRDVSPPGTTGLHFRDLNAFDANHAVALTAGVGTDSRIYTTSNGGHSWRLAYQATDPAVFFDAMAFLDARHGVIIYDPVNGKFGVLATNDGGQTWTTLPSAGMPAAQQDEYGFADSGTMVTATEHDIWFGSGGSASRIYHSHDRGLSWDVAPTPILSGSPNGTAGIYGLAFRTPEHGLAVGGDFLTPDITSHVSAISHDGGPWVSPAREPSGVRFAAAWLPLTRATAVTVGINGSDVSYDAGQHWTRFDDGEFNTVNCAGDGTCWTTGDTGRVAVLHR
jgi:photosystem II stability/assembly factor-like uncharacterized protein